MAYELKTKLTDASVAEFLNRIEDDTRRMDGFRVLEMYRRATGDQPKMWGPAIIGFGMRKYKYPDGREMDWMVAGFSPRKQNLTLYVICDSPNQAGLLAKLGKHTTSKACLYIKKLAQIDEAVLEEVIKDSTDYIRSKS